MPTCCKETLDDQPTISIGKGGLTIALAGNPNCGKTTIFNALTGLRQKVANYPGVTVEKKTGKCALAGGNATIIDLPGTYSLVSRSPDEVVAMEVLRGLRPGTPAPDAVIVVVDASNLQRNLYLVSQLIELGRPLVVALNMMDIARRRGIDVSAELLEKELGVPVVPVVGHKREGIKELKEAVLKARIAPMPDWPLPQVLRDELVAVGAGLLEIGGSGQSAVGSGEGKKLEVGSEKQEGSLSVVSGPLSVALGNASPTTDNGPRTTDKEQLTPSQLATRNSQLCSCRLAERLLVGDNGPDLREIAGKEGVKTLVEASRARLAALGIDAMQADIEAHYRWIETVAGRVSSSVDELAAMGVAGTGDTLSYETPKKRHLSDRADAVLIHKVWGLVIFGLIMGLLFVTIFWLAKPVMDGIKEGVDSLGKFTAGHMSEGPLRDLVKDGIFAGVGAVVVFVPQIAILFFFLAVLEDSGYLARAAFLMDRLLAKVGLHGKSFIPLLSSFACAIPGIMATRTIEDRKSRLATILIAPFMSCSARLPVYTLLIGTFFATYGAMVQAGIVLALYALGIVAAALTAWFFKRTLLKGPTPAFILELPTYKVPQISQISRQVYSNTWSFLAKAGTTIFVLSIVLWALMYYPHFSNERAATLAAEFKKTAVEKDRTEFFSGAESITYRLPPEREREIDGDAEKYVGAEQLRQSIAGRFGHLIEPAIRPLGYDWKMGVGLVGAFAAREVFVSTIGIVYSVGDPGEETTDLAKAMREDTYTAGPRAGKPVWSVPVALSLLVWFVLAMQCMSTLAIVRRETGGWGWPMFMLVYMNALAYVVSLGVYQIAKLFVA